MKKLIISTCIIILSWSVNTSAQDCGEDLIDQGLNLGKQVDNLFTDMLLPQISSEDEMKIGDEIHLEIKKETTFLKTGAKYRKLKKISKKLLPYRQRKDMQFKFHLIDDDEMVNAFAHAGGHVYVTTKIMDFVDSDDELAFILGHEISHVDDKHTIRPIQKMKAAEEIAGEPGLIAAYVQRLLTTPFGQVDEYEADKDGATIAKKAGYDPKKGKDFFIKLKETENYSLVEKLIRTHPYSEQREKCLDYHIDNNLNNK